MYFAEHLQKGSGYIPADARDLNTSQLAGAGAGVDADYAGHTQW